MATRPRRRIGPSHSSGSDRCLGSLSRAAIGGPAGTRTPSRDASRITAEAGSAATQPRQSLPHGTGPGAREYLEAGSEKGLQTGNDRARPMRLMMQ